MTGPA